MQIISKIEKPANAILTTLNSQTIASRDRESPDRETLAEGMKATAKQGTAQRYHRDSNSRPSQRSCFAIRASILARAAWFGV